MNSRWVERQLAFDQAAAWFARIAPAGEGRWQERALGEWTARDLLGHASRALLTVETYLGNPASRAEVTSAVAYFRRMFAAAGDPAAVAQRGRDAGAALGDDPVAVVETIVQRVSALVRAAHADDLVTTPVGGMRLDDYLPTRTFELTVHTCDMARAWGQRLAVPEAAATESLTVLSHLAVDASQSGPLLLAATGRQDLPVGFTVL